MTQDRIPQHTWIQVGNDVWTSPDSRQRISLINDEYELEGETHNLYFIELSSAQRVADLIEWG